MSPNEAWREDLRMQHVQELMDEAEAERARKRAAWRALPDYARTQVYIGVASVLFMIVVVMVAGSVQASVQTGEFSRWVGLLLMIPLAFLILAALDFAARGLLPRYVPFLRHGPMRLRSRAFRLRMIVYAVLGTLLALVWTL